jgi:hypothetical protein
VFSYKSKSGPPKRDTLSVEMSEIGSLTEQEDDGADGVVVPVENRAKWSFFGKQIPRTEIVFVAQVFIVYVVVIVALVNLTRDHDTSTLWTALLSSCLGYLLPNPRLHDE